MEIKGIKFYALVGIITIAYIFGFCLGFGICASSQSAYANKPEVTSIQNVTNTQGVSYDYVYANGQKYIVFMSQSGDIEVVK